MSSRRKRPHSSPSPRKKTPQRGSKRVKSRRAPAAATSKQSEASEQSASAIEHQLLGLFLNAEPTAIDAAHAEADAARQAHGRRAIENFIHSLRTALEPEPVIIPRLAESIVLAAAMLRDAARGATADHQELLAEALLPAARAAVALADFVNRPAAELAPKAHAAGRNAAERWPRIHHANAHRNTETEKDFRKWKIGAGLPRKPAKQDRKTHNSVARDRTIEALCRLLPETMRRCYPVLPLLFDSSGKPIPPSTENGTLAGPYKALAEFIVFVRHSETAKPRAKALLDFLAANDAAAAQLPKKSQLRTEYARTRKRLAAEVKRMDAEPESNDAKAPPAPAWLRRTAPLIAFVSSGRNRTGTRNKSDILRAQNLLIFANALAPIYSRMIAELDAHDALKKVIDRHRIITGKGKTGRDSAAVGYIRPHLDNLRRLHSLTEAELREIATAARTEMDKLEQFARG